MTSAAASDPFESTANAARYVPRPACERVLEAVELALARGGGPVAVTGPAGLGKSMLLAVLAERVAGRYRVVRVPYPALSSAELCRWVLEALGERAAGGEEDSESALLDRAFRESAAGREILLLVDDASSLPPRSARGLASLLSASGGAIRAVVAAVDDARLGAALAALGATTREIRLDEPMSAEETTAYLQARLAGSGGRSARFDADTRARIYGATGGIPRRVHELGAAIWRSPDDADVAALVERWARGDEDDEAEPPSEPIEIDEGPPVFEIGVDEPDELHDLADLTPPPGAPEPERPPHPEPDPDEAPPTRRVRGLVLALVALAVLVVALVEALPRLQAWFEATLPEPPAAAGAREDLGPTAPSATSAEPTPAAEPEVGEAPAEGAASATSEGETPHTMTEDGTPNVLTEGGAPPGEPMAGEEATPNESRGPEAGSAATESSPGAEPSAATAPPTAKPVAPAATTEAPAAEPAPGLEPQAAEPAMKPQAPATEPGAAAPEASPAPPAEAPPEASGASTATPAAEVPAATAATGASAPPAPAPARVRRRRRPRGIEVEVTANPPAVIHVDGGRVGTTPLPALDLSVGLHVFRAEFASGRAVVRAVEISASNHHVHFEPTPEPDAETDTGSDDAGPAPDAAP